MGSSGKWPQIVLSRTCDDFLIRLFEIEVPEIADGIVQIVGVAREPGNRAKIGVRSLDKNVDPVGACVGMRGARIQSIVRELRGEKIDIIEWSDDPAILASRAVTPAKVLTASLNKDEKSVDIVVADDQLALAIGKRGQNAKLAVRLTKCRINITSESERRIVVQESFERAVAQAGLEEATSLRDTVRSASYTQNEQEDFQEPDDQEIYDHQDGEENLDERKQSDITYEQETDPMLMLGLEETTIDLLVESGFSSFEDIASSSVEELISIPGIDYRKALRLLEQARQFLEYRNPKSREVRTDE